MIRDRIVTGIINSSLSLKLQLDSTLILKKAVDATRQNEATKREQAMMRNFLPKVTNVDFVIKAKRQPKPYQPKLKMAAKPQSTNRKCNFCGMSPAHQKAMCPECVATCFNCRKVGHFGFECRSTKSVDANSKKPDPDVAFPGEVTQNDDPWTSTVAMEAMGIQCRPEVCFKLDTGACVTVNSQSDYMRGDNPCLDAYTKKLVGANDNVLQALGKFNDRMSQGKALVKSSTSSVANKGHF